MQCSIECVAIMLEQVTYGPMDFREKVQRLAAESGQSQADLDRRSGLPVNTFAGVMSKGTKPGIENAAAIARGLNVSLDWLSDNERGWPPERPTETSQVTSLLPEKDRSDLLSLAERYGLAACLAAGVQMLLESEPQKKELYLLRLIANRPPKKAAAPTSIHVPPTGEKRHDGGFISSGKRPRQAAKPLRSLGKE